MTDSGQDRAAHIDAQSLRDVDTYIYETVATLEYTGRPATRNQIAGARTWTTRCLTRRSAR